MKNSLITLLFLLIFSSCGHIQTNPDYSNERTLASDNCNDLVGLFLEKKNTALEIPATSLFGKNPQIYEKMESIRLISIDYNKFYQDFLAQNKKAPTLRDVLNHINQSKNKTLKNYELLIADLNQLPNRDSDEIKLFAAELKKAENKVSKFRDVNQINLELQASYEHGKTSIPNIDTMIPLDPNNAQKMDEIFYQYLKVVETLTSFQGEFGELSAMAASKEKVLTRGLTFKANVKDAKTPTDKLIATRVQELQNKVSKMSNEEIIEFINPHKEGLLRAAYHFLEEENFSMVKREIVVNKIFDMIRSKEIDLVTEGPLGKTTWCEVKAYNRPISLKVISGHGKDKTMLDQLKEHKALRDVLGLESTVKLRFISPLSVVEDDAKAAIEALGYEVISAK